VQTGETTTIGRIARLVLLACTLFGLAAMHTIGHSGMTHTGHHHEDQPASAHQVSTMPAFTAAQSDGCAEDGCVHAAALPEGGGGQMDPWDLCLAVLSGFAVALLLAGLLLLAVTGRFPPLFGGGRRHRRPWAPSTLPFGLTVATVSVLRT